MGKWRALLRALQIGSALALVVGAVAIQLPAGAQVELPPTTLPPTTLPGISLTTTSLVDTTLTTTSLVDTTLTTTTLVGTTLPSLTSVTTTEPISSVIDTVVNTTTTTVAEVEDSIEDAVAGSTSSFGVADPLDNPCNDSLLLDSDCEGQPSTSKSAPFSYMFSPVRPRDSGVLEEHDSGPQSEKAEQSQEEEEEEEEEQEEEEGSTPSDPATEPEEEPSPSLLDRWINLIDELLDELDTEVAGVQVLSTTGLAVGMLVSVAVGLLLSGFGILKIPDQPRRSRTAADPPDESAE